jgi:hypothetical protein
MSHCGLNIRMRSPGFGADATRGEGRASTIVIRELLHTQHDKTDTPATPPSRTLPRTSLLTNA